jgi:CRP-like cAMP-binding protein
MMKEVYRKGDDIVCQGDQASSYYLIQEGEIDVIIDFKRVNVL